MKDTKKAMGRSYVERYCDCPYCGGLNDVDKVLCDSEHYDLRYEDGDLEQDIECDECEKVFILSGLDY